jgi:hypothetical protein
MKLFEKLSMRYLGQNGFTSEKIMKQVHERLTCRACHNSRLTEILNLGDQPPANAYIDSINTPEQRYSLSLNLCELCGMVQLAHVVDPELLFSNYSFRTGSSQRMVEHFSRLMSSLANTMQPLELLVEIGANDGVALATVSNRVRVLGVDPAGIPSSVPMLNLPFNYETAINIKRIHGPANAIVACNVLGHVDDLDDFFKGVEHLLSDAGVFVFEVPYLGEMIDRKSWDQLMYHEHLSAFSVRPILTLLERHGLRLERIDRLDVHGGSIRCRVSRGRVHNEHIDRWCEAHEFWRRLTEPDTYDGLSESVIADKIKLQTILTDLRNKCQQVVGYCASAKATVRLNACGIGIDLLSEIIDSTTVKQGRFVPGTHQKIVTPESVDLTAMNTVIVFANNHAVEVEAKLKSSGFSGQIIFP